MTTADARDARIRDIIRQHFHPEEGAPFWRDLAADLSFDPLVDVEGAADLALFASDEAYDSFPADLLRRKPRAFVPDAWSPSAYGLWSTGGRTGNPKWTAWIEDDLFDRTVRMLEGMFVEHDVPTGRDVVHVGPTGPTVFGSAIEEAARRRNANAITIGLDAQWAGRTRSDPDLREAGVDGSYMDDVAERTRAHLRQFSDSVGVFVGTPSVLERLLADSILDEVSLELIVFGGESLDPETFERFRERTSATVVGEYGNTLFGIAPQTDYDPQREEIVYQPTFRQGIYEVMAEDELDAGRYEPVSYGNRGVVVAHVVRAGLFAPYHVETDYATRREPSAGAVVDGLGNPTSPITHGGGS